MVTAENVTAPEQCQRTPESASSKKIKLDISDEDELIDECYMFINSDIVLR